MKKAALRAAGTLAACGQAAALFCIQASDGQRSPTCCCCCRHQLAALMGADPASSAQRSHNPVRRERRMGCARRRRPCSMRPWSAPSRGNGMRPPPPKHKRARAIAARTMHETPVQSLLFQEEGALFPSQASAHPITFFVRSSSSSLHAVLDLAITIDGAPGASN